MGVAKRVSIKFSPILYGFTDPSSFETNSEGSSIVLPSSKEKLNIQPVSISEAEISI